MRGYVPIKLHLLLFNIVHLILSSSSHFLTVHVNNSNLTVYTIRIFLSDKLKIETIMLSHLLCSHAKNITACNWYRKMIDVTLFLDKG